MPSSLNGTGVTFNDTTTLQSGNIPAANLGTGTANSSTFLRGDKTWAAPGAAAPVVNTFNSSGTWTKPSTGTMARIQVWSGGGGGNRTGNQDKIMGGSGGGYAEITIPLGDLASSVSVTVGAGGTGRTGSTGNGGDGGTSSFGALLTVFGGYGGQTDGLPIVGGSAKPRGGVAAGLHKGASLGSTESWAGSSTTNGESSFLQTLDRHSRSAIYGGAAGGSAGSLYGDISGLGGQSALGGNGGNSGAAGTQPAGGGGGGTTTNSNGGNGGAGRVIVTVW